MGGIGFQGTPLEEFLRRPQKDLPICYSTQACLHRGGRCSRDIHESQLRTPVVPEPVQKVQVKFA